jgi:hypothetical protein
MTINQRSCALLRIIVVTGLLAWSAVAQGAATTAIPCFAKSKAVIANTGQSIHNSNSLVNGDVQAGQSIIQQGGIITGTKTPNTPAGLAVVPPPPGATNLGNFVLGSNQVRNLTAGNYVASSFILNSGSRLTVSGGIVQVWVTGGLTLGGHANDNGTPENLEFLVTGTQDAHVNSGATTSALIYAPAAPVLVDAVLHGSVVGSRTTLNSGGQVLFDPGSTCPPPTACVPASSIGLLVQGNNVDAYAPFGDWAFNALPNVRRIRVEGTATPNATISTALPVTSCASSSGTGRTVCSTSGTTVYVLSGTTLTNTLTNGSTAVMGFSGTSFGGGVNTASVAMDPVHNRAALAIGLAGAAVGGIQFLDLTANPPVFAPPVALGAVTSENVLVDPFRNLVLSPNEGDNYVLLNTSSNTAFSFQPNMPALGFDSAAEDCSTGVALASLEGGTGVFLTNVASPPATFVGSSWSAPAQIQAIPEFTAPPSIDEPAGIAVDSNTHLGIVTGEFGGTGIVVFRLPATNPGATAPAFVDWARTDIPNDPTGTPWAMAGDPHAVTVYQSPATGNRAFAVLANNGGSIARTFLAVVDLQAVLDAPRTGHLVTSLPASAVRFVAF